MKKDKRKFEWEIGTGSKEQKKKKGTKLEKERKGT